MVQAGWRRGGENPDLVGLSAEEKPVIRRIVESLTSESDSAKLHQALAQLEAQAASLDPKKQQLQRVIQKKVAARIAEL